MGKSAGYQALPSDGEPDPWGVKRSASDASLALEGSTAGGNLSAVEHVLQSVDSNLRFSPSSTLAPTRRWLHIDDRGAARLVEVDKHRLVESLGIRYRDLLALDPSVPIPCPANLLIRERAMVVNLEAVRMIVCANQVYLLSVPKEGDPRIAAAPLPDNPFVRQLCRVLGGGGSGSGGGGASASLGVLQQPAAVGGPTATTTIDPYLDTPFELRAVECGLEAAVQQLSLEVAALEAEAYPALDRLAEAVSRGVLEAVRNAKGTTVRLTGRVQRIRQEIETIMADDVDMQDMYLGRRAALLGQGLPPQPAALPGAPRPHRTYGNLLGLAGAQQEPLAPAGSSAARLPRAASSGSDLAAGAGAAGAAAAGTAAGPAAAAAAGGSSAPLAPGDAWAGGKGGGAPLPQPQLADSWRPGSPGRGGASRAAQLWARGGSSALRRAGVVVRTVRRLRRAPGDASSPGLQAQGQASGGGDAAAGEAASSRRGAEDGDEGGRGVIEEEEEEVVEALPGGALVDPHDIQDVEDLLEAYFMQVDYLLRRLLLLSERTAATEALLSLEMDSRRNELVALDLFVTCITGSFAFVGMIAGIFGMNVTIGDWTQSQTAFALLVAVMVAGGTALLVLILLYIKKRRLMFITAVD